MQDQLTWLTAISAITLLGLVRFWLPKYFEEKAKNFAQKEDLHELTTITEKVKSEFERGSLVFRAQFEAEYTSSKQL